MPDNPAYLRQMTGYAAAYADLRRALATPVDSRTPDVWGTVEWAAVFDAEDLTELHDEWALLLLDAQVTGSTGILCAEIAAWRTTARLLADPTSRAMLLADCPDEDFVEVLRPTGDSDNNLY